MNFYALFKRRQFAGTANQILRIMKLTIIILFTSLLHVSAASFAQRISLNKNKAPLHEVIREIRKQSGYDFVITTPQIKSAKPVSIKVTNKPLKEVLDECFADQPFSYIIEDKIITITNKAAVPVVRQQEITGVVLDETNKPVPGASVRIKGIPAKVVATDKNGKFRIQGVSENDVLVVSYLGYKPQEIKIKANQSTLTIKLEISENEMNEVVISTGIFKKSAESFTGSSTTVTAKELASFGNRNLITSLRNIDPSFNIIESNSFGSNPNRLPDIQIRGNSSLPNIDDLDNLSGLNTPLVILDGFQSTLQRMLDINENEVESITILKDAAATAIYGSRGSNGVIVITTKLPQAGSLKISYRADVNIEMADLSDYNVLDARQKLDLEQRVGLYNNAAPEADLKLKNYYNYLINEVNSGVNTYWLDMPLRTGVGQRHNFSLSGGDNTFRYSASAQVNNIQGAMKGSARNTFNGTVNLAYTYRNIKFSNRLIITEGKSSESPYGSFSDYVRMNPYWRAYDAQGKALKIMGDPGTNDYEGRWFPLPTSPLYNATLNVFDKGKTSELTNNTSVEWSILKSLQLRGQIGISKGTTQTDKFRPADHTAFANYSGVDIFRKGDYNYGIGNSFNYDGGLNLQYSETFNGKHTIFGGFDFNVRQNKNAVYGFLAEGFANPNFDFVSMALQYGKDKAPTGNESLTRALGFTGNVNYIYDNRYFIDASYRLDGASQFGSRQRFAPFWSTGLGWNMHNEEFMKNNGIVDRLKLRGSVGITGSQNFNAYQALSTYRYYSADRYFNWTGAYLLGLGNKDLKWQQALKYDIGFDAEFLKGRIKVVGDYYTGTTKDLVSQIDLPASNGFSSYIENIGKMRNRGFELKVTGVLVNKPGELYWSVTGAVIQNRNMIIETSKALKDAQKSRQDKVGAAPTKLYFEGYSTNAIWVMPSLGIDPSTGKELYMDRNGNPTYDWSGQNLRAIGNTDPDFLGNFSTMVRYKNLSMNASFGYRFGGQMYNQTLIDKVENADFKYNVDSRVYDHRWQQPGDDAAFKGLLVTTPTYRTSRFVENENSITCQNINLLYELRSKAIQKNLGLSYLSFSANMAEPFRFSSIQQERGTVYPFSRQLSFSVNATF
ncbi:SusC/RagA family TonB-linked outer membrane protein [Pedobacter nyackensis]|uniref:SusC/RagA family TonB-linked outer membrane protein n=1 Tax=Pedobacter nyackensis TaxID=475255 RepID=UPI00292DEBDE|nr:SusC/RagA family TonB-linked outer membrane protein [Pedobacter nyackensis]